MSERPEPWTPEVALQWEREIGQPWAAVASAENAAAAALLAHLQTKKNRRKNRMYDYCDTYELRDLAVALVAAIDADRAFISQMPTTPAVRQA